MSEAAKEERAERKLKTTEGKNEALLETNKPSNKTETPVAEPEFNIEEIYEGANENPKPEGRDGTNIVNKK